jgi:hypothetical protein
MFTIGRSHVHLSILGARMKRQAFNAHFARDEIEIVNAEASAEDPVLLGFPGSDGWGLATWLVRMVHPHYNSGIDGMGCLGCQWGIPWPNRTAWQKAADFAKC